jgi:hypothetical protein
MAGHLGDIADWDSTEAIDEGLGDFVAEREERRRKNLEFAAAMRRAREREEK